MYEMPNYANLSRSEVRVQFNNKKINVYNTSYVLRVNSKFL